MLRHGFFPNQSYVISEQRGFLPDKNPASHLPLSSSLNIALNQLVLQLPELLKTKQLRPALEKLDATFSNDDIVCEKGQRNTAILILLMLAQGYVWEDAENPAQTIPAVIARNLYAICKDKRRLPAFTYSDYVLQNWKLIDPEASFSLENIDTLFTFTDSKDEKWFIKIHVAIEAMCAQALHAAYQACNVASAIHTGVEEKPILMTQLAQHLTTMSESIVKATDVMRHMLDEIDPAYYWAHLRPYLFGWEKVKTMTADQVEQQGVLFAGVKTGDRVSTYSFKGPSGAESSILPALDAVLGVKHEVNGMYQTLLTFQQYMPDKHVLFIKALARSKVNAVVEQSDEPELRLALQQAISAVTRFRGAHMGLVHQFIYKPAAQQNISYESVVGTGGSPIDAYLGDRLTQTQREAQRFDKR